MKGPRARVRNLLRRLPAERPQQRVVWRALEHRPQASGDALQLWTNTCLDLCLKGQLALPGLEPDEVCQAPTADLLYRVGPIAWDDDWVALAVLHLWFQTEAALRQTVSAFMAREGVRESRLAYGSTRVTAWHPGEFHELAQALAAQEKSTEEFELELMLQCLAGATPAEDGVRLVESRDAPAGDADTVEQATPAHAEEPEPAGVPDRYQGWLHELADLGPDAAEVDAWPAFVEAGAAEIERKLTERSAADRAVEEALGALQHGGGEQLAWLGVDDAVTWTGDDLAPEAREETLRCIAALQETLDAVGSVREERPASRMAERAHREALDAACDAALSAAHAVRAALGLAEAESPQQAPPEPEAQAEAAEEAEADAEAVAEAAEVTEEAPPAEAAAEAPGEAVEPAPAVEPTTEPEPRVQEPPPVLPKTQEADGVRGLGEEVLRERVRTSLASRSEASSARPALAELQRRWLVRGANLGGHVLARHAENLGIASGEPPIIPSWQCWLALLLGDPAADGMDLLHEGVMFHIAQFSEAAGVEQQRFLACWLAYGLLSDSSHAVLELVEGLPAPSLRGDWTREHPLYAFCSRKVVLPAVNGQRPRLRPQEDVTLVTRRRDRCLQKAEDILRLPNAYRNTAVRRYWAQMTSPHGPLGRRLADARKGKFGSIPHSAQELTTEVNGFAEIVAEYRQNMLSRLGAFVEHLEAARGHAQRAGRSRQVDDTMISMAEVESLLEEAETTRGFVAAQGRVETHAVHLLLDWLARNAREGKVTHATS